MKRKDTTNKTIYKPPPTLVLYLCFIFLPPFHILHNSNYVELLLLKIKLLHNLRHKNKTDVYIIKFIGQFSVPIFVQMGEICKKWLKFLILYYCKFYEATYHIIGIMWSFYLTPQ